MWGVGSRAIAAPPQLLPCRAILTASPPLLSPPSRKMLGKGQKRKRSEEVEPAVAPPSSALFSISLSKLHQSLQQGEPDLRHLVLVANTLRRIRRDQMEPASAPGLEDSGQQGPCGRPPPLPPPSLAPVDQLLLSGTDTSIFSSILEDLARVEGFSDPLCPPLCQPEDHLLCGPGPEESRWTAQPGLAGPLELLGPAGGALLEDEDGLDGVFEDIDTSMYDCHPWTPSKEACAGTLEGRRDLADLDYLLDVLMGVDEL